MQFGISEAVAHWGKYTPELPAFQYNGKTATYREFNDRINVLCNQVGKSDLQGTRVAIAIDSKFSFLIVLVAILRLGKSAVLLNIGLPDAALTSNIEDTEVVNIVHDTNNQRVADLVAESGENTLCISEITDLPQSSPVIYKPHIIRQPNEEWGVVFSSGTTGTPKGIVRDHNSIITELLGWCLELGLTQKTAFYVGRPVYYTGGLVLALSTLLVGGTVFANDYSNDNDPNEIWFDYQNVLQKNKIDWAFFIPDQIRFFIHVSQGARNPPYAAKKVLAMGAPISGKEKTSAARVLRSVIIESWGNSESLGTITSENDLAERPDSIGRPFLTDEMYIVDDECVPQKPLIHGRIAGNEEAGFFKYCNRPNETKRVKRNALIISDDIGYTDEDGYFYVCGRDQDCIIIDNKPVFISDIEEKVRQTLGIHECGIVTKATNEISVELIAVIIPSSDDISDVEILNRINSILSPREQLASVLLTDRMPRLPSGKIDRISLKNMVERK